jgi:hypothetical protein
MRSGLQKQRSGPVLDHDGDRRFAEECVQIVRTAKSPETTPPCCKWRWFGFASRKNT